MENNQKNPHPLASLIDLAEEVRAKQKKTSKNRWNQFSPAVKADRKATADAQTAFDDALAIYRQLDMPNPIGPMLQGLLFALAEENTLLLQNIDEGDTDASVANIDEIRELMGIIGTFELNEAPRWRADRPQLPPELSVADLPTSFFDDFDKQTE